MSEQKTKSKSSFINLFIAIVTGDDAEAKAQKAAYQAKAALKAQINAQEGLLEDCKVNVEEAEERLAEALVNRGQVIKGPDARNRYAENLLAAKNTLTEAEEALSEKKEMIKFFREQLAQI